jgi:hypothetical protein
VRDESDQVDVRTAFDATMSRMDIGASARDSWRPEAVALIPESKHRERADPRKP